MTTDTNQPTAAVNTPTFVAYHVSEPQRRGQKARWNRIGAFFAHEDAEGGTLILDSLPIAFDGRIVLRAPKADVA